MCLSNILVGLVVTWTGFIKKARWAWFVMFIIVWIGAFPVLVLPLVQNRRVLNVHQWANSAFAEPGGARTWAEGILIFATMVIALLLPMKSFFWCHQSTGEKS